MSKENNFLGVETFKLGTPGDGIMGTSLTNYPDVEVGSVNVEGAQQNEETISTETNDSYLTVNGESTPASVTARLFGVTPAQLVVLAGGEVDANSGLWNAPKSSPNLYLSFEMKGKAVNGKKGVLLMPYAKVNARVQGTITKNGLPAVDVTLTANTPVSSSNVEGSPYSYGVESV